MAADEITVVQKCGVCSSELGNFTVKKDNMMLSTRETIWCPNCQAKTREMRDLTGRAQSIEREVESLPEAGSS